jgi:predicted nucleotidyltransferase
MRRKDVLYLLAIHKEELHQQFHVKSLAIFGSVARDEATDVSDVDLLVEFDCPTGYFGLIALQDHLEKLFQCHVDVGTAQSLKPRIRAKVIQESVHVA